MVSECGRENEPPDLAPATVADCEIKQGRQCHTQQILRQPLRLSNNAQNGLAGPIRDGDEVTDLP